MVWFVGMVRGLRALVGVGSCTSDCHRVEEGGGCGGVSAEWMVMLAVVEWRDFIDDDHGLALHWRWVARRKEEVEGGGEHGSS